MKTSFTVEFVHQRIVVGLNVTLNEKEEIVVSDCSGGPADKTKKIEKDDVILKVSNKEGEEYLVSCAPSEKIGETHFFGCQ